MERKYLVTERAHLMCPNMCFGVFFRVDSPYDEKHLIHALESLARTHSFLRSLIRKEDSGHYYYEDQNHSMIDYSQGVDAKEFMKEYQSVIANAWDTRTEGLLQVFGYDDEEETGVLFVAHHLLTDGRGLLQLAELFADVYVMGVEPQKAEEMLIRDVNSLPRGSELGGISRILVHRANKQWKKEKHTLSYTEYLSYEKQYLDTHRVIYRELTIDAKKLEEIQNACHKAEVSVNDYLMARMYQKEKTNKIVIAADIRNELADYQEGAMGNYSTAMGIACKLSSKEDVMISARKVHKAARRSLEDNRKRMMVLACYLEMNPELLDAAAAAALGRFDSKAATFVGKGMFGMDRPTGYSITNLGRCQNENLTEAVFIPPASLAMKKTAGVITLGGVMHICVSEYVDERED